MLSLRHDQRPWCSIDRIFEGKFVFCPESEEDMARRLSLVKSADLFEEGMKILQSNSRTETYQVGLAKLISSFELGNIDAQIYLAQLKMFGLHFPQVTRRNIYRTKYKGF